MKNPFRPLELRRTVEYILLTIGCAVLAFVVLQQL